MKTKRCAVMIVWILLISQAGAAVKLPPMSLQGNGNNPTILKLGSPAVVEDKNERKLYVDERCEKIRLVAQNNDFNDELSVFKKYRFQYAMFAGIIFAGLFFVVINNK